MMEHWTAQAILLLFTVVTSTAAFSFSPDGYWVNLKGQSEENICKRNFQCVLGQNTWKAAESKFYNATEACASVVGNGIDTIYFYGDSYMRQIYAATLISFNGNYRNGSLDSDVDGDGIGCTYREQFNEKRCGVRQLNRDTKVCDGKVRLQYMVPDRMDLDACQGREGGSAIVLFSQGNHKIRSGDGGRVGVNDHKLHSEMYEAYFCSRLRNHAKNEETTGVRTCGYWWMSTHQRIIGWFDDEKPQVVKKFNEGMRRFFDGGRCGNFNYIDVFNMTDSLVKNFTLDATSEANKAKSLSVSYDYVHYGMEINLLKAQTFINALSNYYKRASIQSV